jgi:hypothetical protein
MAASACQAREQPFPEGKEVFFLDSLEAAARVGRDEAEGFFDKINGLDRAIQMQSETIPSLEEYREFLRRDALSFSQREKDALLRELQTVYALCEKTNPNLLPDTLCLIKTRGDYYGPSVFYTRENCIVIPEDALASTNGLQEVLLHELFHIVSRYNPDLRQTLYALIGFEPLRSPVALPPALSERLLLNPDGIPIEWAIGLEGGVQAVPLIFSRYDAWQSSYFAHLDFQLFALEMDEQAGHYRILISPDGRSTLGPDHFVSYLQKVKDNTTYLIHPDEILADNFIWAVSEDETSWRRFSEEGRALLLQMRDAIKNRKGG